MKKLATLVLAAAAATLTMPASAQFAKPEDAIKYRKAALTVMAAHFGRIGAMTSGKAPFDARTAAENAEVVADMARLPWAAFGEGTDKGETKAKPEIWKEQAKFREGHEKLASETMKLAAAAKTGNLDNLKLAFTSTAGTCKSCHDAYRDK